MNFTFLRSSEEVAFFRSDAEQAEWTQEEMSLLCTFPVIRDKIIQRGMIVLFQDPATNEYHAYEIRNCTILPGEYYQQFTAESLAISELTDCHIQDEIELTSVSVASALGRVLSGTGWSIGNIGSQNVSFGDISRGSVWQAVSTIRSNWNVYIEPRVTVNAHGITGRYLDIIPTDGVWRGLRISVDKNTSDPIVTYDDSELYTALYGYGGTYSAGEEYEEQTYEYDFTSVTWAKTADHPAKPYGQKYLEYPEKTALYGRNGKPRFGYYQNTEIKDPNVLLQKTWESLNECCDPKINISGTVTDLKRLGYNDEPLRLHDMVIVDLEPIGEMFYKQIIQLTVNLLDPTGNRPTIGDYIPNIVYINRETEDFATGGSKGVGGGGGSSKKSKQEGEFRTSIDKNDRNIHLNARRVDNNENILQQAGMFIDPITGVLIYAEDKENMVGAKFRVQSNRITAEVNERTAQGAALSSRITQESNRISLEVSERKAQGDALSSRITITAREIRSEVSDSENRTNSRITQTATEIRSEVTASEAGLSSRITQNANKVSIVVDDNNNLKTASIVAGINDQSGSYIKLQADKIDLSGYVTASDLSATNAEINNLKAGQSKFTFLNATSAGIDALTANNSFRLGSYTATWKLLQYKNHSGTNSEIYVLGRNA